MALLPGMSTVGENIESGELFARNDGVTGYAVLRNYDVTRPKMTSLSHHIRPFLSEITVMCQEIKVNCGVATSEFIQRFFYQFRSWCFIFI